MTDLARHTLILVDRLRQINPSYKAGASLESLIRDGALDPRTIGIFRDASGPLSLYKHQEQAIALAAHEESYVLTTGTGSGKSLSFFIPIVRTALSERRHGPARRTRAIVIYPMNALANSQMKELDKFVSDDLAVDLILTGHQELEHHEVRQQDVRRIL